MPNSYYSSKWFFKSLIERSLDKKKCKLKINWTKEILFNKIEVKNMFIKLNHQFHNKNKWERFIDLALANQ